MRIFSQIYVNEHHPIARGRNAQGSSSTEAGGVSSPESAPDVRVTVSSRAHELADEASVDQAKVDRLKEAIVDGSFQIDSQRIAERIVDLE